MLTHKRKLELSAIISTISGYYKDAIRSLEQLHQEKAMETNEKWDVKISYEVKGKEIYSDTQEWKGIKPEKVGIMMRLLKEAQEKFIKEASSV